jgi:hypothetical protein
MPERVIDEGDDVHGVHWTLSASGDDDSYGTVLQMVDQDGLIDSGGMGGPKLWGTNRLNVYTGRNPVRGPKAVVARCSPLVANVVLSFRDETSRDITARQGAVVDGLNRFGVAVVAPDVRLGAIVGRAGDGTEVERYDLRHHDEGWHPRPER